MLWLACLWPQMAMAQTLTTFNSEASYAAALPSPSVTTTVESFSAVTADRLVSTGTPDVWTGFTLAALGTSPWGSSTYCASLSACMSYTPSPAALPGVYGAMAQSVEGGGRLTFTLDPGAIGFGLNYWDWNDGGQRSQLAVTLSNGAIVNVTGPTTILGDPGGFIGFRIDQGSADAGIVISSVVWLSQVSSEIVGIGNVRVSKANPLVVTNTNDSGAGSLRNAVIFANTKANADTISFNIPGAGPHTIALFSALPDLTANGMVIDGSTQSGTQCRDLWLGNGHDLRVNVRGNGGFDGFRLAGANQVVRGLSVTSFDQAIRLLPISNNATVECNYLGLLANGSSSGNNRGVWVSGASARIGGTEAGQGNVISANAVAGVLTVNGSTDTAIRGNFIGTDVIGLSARANGTAINNYNGTATWRDITRNLIAGNNGSAGIALETDDRITPSDGQIRIQANIIGANRSATALLRNGGEGILFDANSITGVLIGGTGSTEGNTITGNDDGIDLRSVSNVRIRGNSLVVSGARGINLNNVSMVEIGGTSIGQGNSIGGNGTDGIYATNSSSGLTIYGNLIQPVTLAGSSYANGGHGIWLDRTSNVTIGDGTASGRNVIGGNRRRGIQGSDTNSGVTINGNYIGTNASGNAAVINGQNEGASRKDAISFDGGTNFSNLAILNNVIGGYEAALIEAWGSTGNGLTIQGNSIGVGANGSAQIVSANTEDLVYLGGGGSYSNVLIGGSIAGQGNTIAFSNRSGIRLETGGSNIQVLGNTIRNNTRNGIYLVNTTRAALVSNRIFANGLIGIDLGENGVTANDAGDGDTGSNEFLNFPQIVSARVLSGNRLQYNLRLDAPAAASGYRIEFFANATADPTGFGEGERYLGHVDVTHGGGTQSYTGTLAAQASLGLGDHVSTTTTRRTAGGTWDITSEFSAVATAQGAADLSVVMASEVFTPLEGDSFATPGSDMVLTATATNVGGGSTDPDSIFMVLSINPDNAFRNEVTAAFGGVVGFTSGSGTLTFSSATDLRFSNGTTPPASFGQCTHTPAEGYDAQVRYVCINPKGTMPPGEPSGQFAVRLRVRIN